MTEKHASWIYVELLSSTLSVNMYILVKMIMMVKSWNHRWSGDSPSAHEKRKWKRMMSVGQRYQNRHHKECKRRNQWELIDKLFVVVDDVVVYASDEGEMGKFNRFSMATCNLCRKKGGGGNKNKSARQVRKWKSTFKEKKIHWIEWWWNFALKKSSFLLFSHKKSTTLTFYVQTFTYMYQWIFVYEKIQSATRK